MLHAARGTLVAAAVAATFALAACDQRSDTAATRSPAPPTVSGSSGARTSADANRAAERAGDAANRAADRTGQAASDSAITAKVKAALLAEPGLDSLDIHVDTKDGAVTLSGNVDSAAKKSRAKEVATNVSGVKNVRDNMTVKQG